MRKAISAITSLVLAGIISVPISTMAMREQSKPDYIPIEWNVYEETTTEEATTLTYYELATPTKHTEMVTYYDVPISEELQDDIRALCLRYALDYELIMAVAMTERSCKVDAVGDSGDAVGLMQIQPRWWTEIIADTGLDVTEPLGNVELALIILNLYISENGGDIRKALNQYNTGVPNNVTAPYYERVMANVDYIKTVSYEKEVEN